MVENNRVSEAATAILIRDGYEETNIFEFGTVTVRGNTVTDCVHAVMVYRHEKNVGEKPFCLIVTDNSFFGGAAGTRFAGKTAIALATATTGEIIRDNTFANFTSELYPVKN